MIKIIAQLEIIDYRSRSLKASPISTQNEEAMWKKIHKVPTGM